MVIVKAVQVLLYKIIFRAALEDVSVDGGLDSSFDRLSTQLRQRMRLFVQCFVTNVKSRTESKRIGAA